MNKLAILAFALLLFFSTMLWYLANGSLNDYLKSQVTLQSKYYSSQEAQLLSADFSNNTGITQFTDFSLKNIDGLSQPLLFKIDTISAQLAKVPNHQLNSPSLDKKTTTVIHIKELRFGNVQAWSELSKEGEKGQTNLDRVFKTISIQLAKDYPALYPKISAELYAKAYPDRNEILALENSSTKLQVQEIETNKAIIASNEAKNKKRLLGKAQTRIIITNVLIDNLTLHTINSDVIKTEHFNNISLGRFGNDNGLDSNQLGGELLKQFIGKLISLEKINALNAQ